jgi:DNA-binding NtrC family response regulator
MTDPIADEEESANVRRGTAADRAQRLAPGPSAERPSSRPPSSVKPRSEFGALRASSAEMRCVFGLLSRIASTDLGVTLLGETGSGKDHLARQLHLQSQRAGGPFVVFDCGAVAATRVESELFGHAKRAHVDPTGTERGAFERASGGTLFLDAVAELPLDVQPRLLRVLENGSIQPVARQEQRGVDVRVIAASSRHLKELVAEGSMRQDLYFRLGATVVSIPPLRARLPDLPLLTAEFLAEFGRPEMVVSEQAHELMTRHSWPGNVRELRNALACALAFVDGGTIELEHLALVMGEPTHDPLEQLPLAGQTLAELERAAIKQTLSRTRGVKAQAARALGIAVSTLYEKLKKYDLDS